MTSREFCYWLQGFFEIADARVLTSDQTAMIKRHLSLVFKHDIDPSYGDNASELQAIHDGKKPPQSDHLSYPFQGDQGGPIVRC